MESSAETPIYQYESLPDPTAYIRLLQICSIDETRHFPVHCQLTSWSLDTTPEYTAISYRWGDRNLLEHILVDGKRMEVRQNCGYVLRQAWRHKGSGYIWIDAICINQISNDEKSRQVAMMGSLYQKAVQTLACVGWHENDSEFLYKCLRGKTHRSKLRRSTTRLNLFLHDAYWVFHLRSTKRLLKAFNSFVGRQYFHRVWIYQELFLGRNVQVCCENDSAPVLDLFQLFRFLLTCAWSHKMPTYFFSKEDRQEFCKWTIFVEWLFRTGIGDRDKENFYVVLSTVSRMECEDRRDRVYGTLAVVDWEGAQPVEPDYNKDVFDLALEVLRILRDLSIGNKIRSACALAESLRLGYEYSETLNDAIQERLGLSSSNIIPIKPQRLDDEAFAQTFTMFWGTRLLFNNGTWEFSRNKEASAAGRSDSPHGEAFDSLSEEIVPTIKKWSEERSLDASQADIVLPQDAHPQHWVLVPASIEEEDDEFDGCYVGFLAEEHDDNRFYLVSKLLIFGGSLWRSSGAWNGFWENHLGCSSYAVHVDPEDVLLLAHSLGWDSTWNSRNSIEERKQVAEEYFGTRLCSAEYRSYAVPYVLGGRIFV